MLRKFHVFIFLCTIFAYYFTVVLYYIYYTTNKNTWSAHYLLYIEDLLFEYWVYGNFILHRYQKKGYLCVNIFLFIKHVRHALLIGIPDENCEKLIISDKWICRQMSLVLPNENRFRDKDFVAGFMKLIVGVNRNGVHYGT